jgi:glycosyltransferase involved in cell wall biosynthesis
MGRPLITTRVAGLPELVVDGETGVLLEPEDGEALATAILSLLAHPAETVRVGAAARRRALDTFGWERHLSAYEALYHALASRPSGAATAQARASAT